MLTEVKYPRYMDVKKNKFFILEDKDFKYAYTTILDLKNLNAEIIKMKKHCTDGADMTVLSSENNENNILVIFKIGLTEYASDFVGFSSKRQVTIVRKSEVTNALALKKHFNCPEFFYSMDPSRIIYNLKPDKNYILKSLYQALGYGKILFNPSKDLDVIEDIIMSYKSKNVLFLEKHSSMETSGRDEVTSFNTNHYFIMEDIGYENIKEYRILLTSSGYYYIQDRKGYHPHDKADKEFINLNEPIEESIIPKKDMEDILSKLRLVMFELDAPFMSFDLYVRLDVSREDFYNRYGCFECSLEFGHTLEYVKLLQFRKAMTISLYNFCMYKINSEGKFLDFIGGDRQKTFEQITI